MADGHRLRCLQIVSEQFADTHQIPWCNYEF
jgi:hypothetical protein